MDVSIKSIGCPIPIKSTGIEIDVAKPNKQGRHGDLIVTKTGLIWCKGRAPRAKGAFVEWQVFIDWMESRDAVA